MNYDVWWVKERSIERVRKTERERERERGISWSRYRRAENYNSPCFLPWLMCAHKNQLQRYVSLSLPLYLFLHLQVSRGIALYSLRSRKWWQKILLNDPATSWCRRFRTFASTQPKYQAKDKNIFSLSSHSQYISHLWIVIREPKGRKKSKRI